MTQLAIDFTPLARRTDPATSHAAADRAREFVASHEARILGWLHGSEGLTYREIAALAHMEPVAVARRMKALEEKRCVRRDGTRAGMTVWKA